MNTPFLRQIQVQVLGITLLPVLFYLLAYLIPGFPGDSMYKKIFYPLLTITFVISILLHDDKYLVSYHADDDRIKIIYMTPLFKLKVIEFKIADIVHLEYEGANRLIENFDCFSVMDKKNWTRFRLLPAKQRRLLKEIVLSFNSNRTNSGIE